MRGGVQKYAAQEIPQIDTARGKKDRFRMETRPMTGFRKDKENHTKEEF